MSRFNRGKTPEEFAATIVAVVSEWWPGVFLAAAAGISIYLAWPK